MDADTIYRRRWLILSVTCLSLVLVVVSVSSLNVALPTMQRQLSATGAELQWIIDSYGLVFAGLLLPAGALGDRFGRKRALQFGLVLFGVAAGLGALAQSPTTVIIFRSLMGVGAAFIMPATLSIITQSFPPHERTKAIAIWTGFAGAGGAIGPVTSGLLLEEFDWPAVFLINIPFAALALLAGLLILPNSRDPESSPLDFGGALLSMGGLLALLYAVIEGPNIGWLSVETLGLFGVAIALLAGFVVWELRNPHPMLDPRLFRIPAFSVGSMAITLSFFAMFGMFFLLTLYFQFVQGHSPLQSGLRGLPMAGALILVAPRSAVLVARFGSRPVIVIGLAVLAVGLLTFLAYEPDTDYAFIAISLVLMAVGMGLLMPPATSSIVASVPAAKAGVGSAMNDLTREVGGAVGIAVMGSVLASAFRSNIRADLQGLPPAAAAAAEESIGAALGVAASLDAAAGPALTAAARESFTDALGITMVVAAVVVGLGALAALRFMPPGVYEPGAHDPSLDEPHLDELTDVDPAASPAPPRPAPSPNPT